MFHNDDGKTSLQIRVDGIIIFSTVKVFFVNFVQCYIMSKQTFRIFLDKSRYFN